MKNLIFILLLVAFVGCGTETEIGFEPYKVGAWMVNTPTQADYIGVEGQLKSVQSDTIEIRSPGQRSLSIFKQSQHETRQFSMQFVDSTVNHGDYVEHDIQRPVLVFPKTAIGKYPLSSGGYGMDYSENYIKSRIDMETTCDHSGLEDQNSVIMVRYEKGDGTLFRAYRIQVDGILQAVRDIACG